MRVLPLLAAAVAVLGAHSTTTSAPTQYDVLEGAWQQQYPGLNPAVGNGLLGWSVGSDSVYSAGLFCQHNRLAVLKGATRARVAAPDTLRVDVPNSSSLLLSLDLRRGVVEDNLFTTDGVNITRRWYAHRSRPSIIVSELVFTSQPTSTDPVTVALLPNSSAASDQLTLTPIAIPNATALTGQIKHPETGATPINISIVSTVVPQTVVVPAAGKSIRVVFLTSIVTDAPFLPTASASSSPAATLALAQASFANATTDELAEPGALLNEHVDEWATIWEHGGVEITMNASSVSDTLPLPEKVNSSLYYLLSSVRSDVPYPVGPGGLMTNGYDSNGFWDNDVWAMPALLPSWPELAKTGLTYRWNLRDAAAKHASKDGFAGLWYPWQTAGTGNECDLFEMANKLEIHVGGGIALLLQNLLLYSGDESWGHSVAAELAAGISDFFYSRSTPNKDDATKLSITGVVPPDEFATGFPLYDGVTDSVYTNAIAAKTARFALWVSAPNASSSQIAQWSALANNITILEADAPSGGKYHPEYLHFPAGNTYAKKQVKQADVTMLGFPLQVTGVGGGTLTQRNNLEYYEPMYDPEGPAMTSSISLIAWLELGETDRAAQWLQNATSHIHAPFAVWTESTSPDQHQSLTDEGCYHFMTGAGGFVQSVVNGYGGVRVHTNASGDGSVLSLNMTLPPSATEFTLRSVSFAGARLRASLNATGVSAICVIETSDIVSGFTVGWPDDHGRVPTDIRAVGECAYGPGWAFVAPMV